MTLSETLKMLRHFHLMLEDNPQEDGEMLR